jgi:hypothetical protein
MEQHKHQTRSLVGLWRDGNASYHFHTPLEYEIIEKGENNPHYNYNYVKIKPISIGMDKRTMQSVLFRKEGLVEIDITNHCFWIPRRMIRRGPKDWARLTNRWVHKETFDECLGRAYKGNNDYESYLNWSY